MNEADLCELILENTHLLKCFECGATLESKMNHATNKTAVGILHIDPGESNYPREPDISASAYFECMDCHETEGRLDSRILELAKTNSIVYTAITQALDNRISEKEMLIRIAPILVDANKTLTDELIRIRSRGPTEVVAV